MKGSRRSSRTAGRRHRDRRAERAAVADVGPVLDAAARYLEVRPRSVSEVRRRLLTAGFAEELVEAAIGRLLEVGYLDDLAFARAWVASRDRARPRGAVALRRELRLRGVDEAVIEAVLAEREAEAVAAGPGGERAEAGAEPTAPSDRRPAASGGGSADAEAAARLLARRAPALARIADPQRRRARAYALLARAGFEPDLAAELARSAAAELDAEPGEG